MIGKSTHEFEEFKNWLRRFRLSIKDFKIRSCSSSIAMRDRVRLEEEECVYFLIIIIIYDNCLAAADNDAVGGDFAPSPPLGVFGRFGF